MDVEGRRALYLRDRDELTTKQRKRLRTKENQENARTLNMTEGQRVGRPGRLRRRFDRKDQKRRKIEASRVAGGVRFMRRSSLSKKDRSQYLG